MTYSNNSLRNRNVDDVKSEKKPEIKKVQTKGKTKIKKKSEISKIASAMISEEVTSIKEYAVYEVIIPVIKDTITQLVRGSIDMLFYGEIRSNSSRQSSTNASKVSYRDYYDGRRDSRIDTRRDSRPIQSRVSYDTLTWEYKEDAMEILDRMDEIVEQYGVVRVADLFEMAGVTGNGPTDHNYGWTSITSASVERDRYGEYYIKLQRPSPIR